MMRNRFYNGLLLLVMCALVPGGAEAINTYSQKIIRIEADEWCPINCDPGSPQPGIGIELAKRIFEPLGYKVYYIVVPWAQALEDVRSGKADAVVGANTTDDPNLIFPENPIANITDDFFVLQGVSWRYQGEFTLKGKRLGVIDGYGYGDIVTKFINDNKNVVGIVNAKSGKDALKKNIEDLLTHRIDVLVESKLVMDYTLQKMQLDNTIIWAGGVPQAPVYLAFSPALLASRERQIQYDQGIRQLRDAGMLDNLYVPYNFKR